MICPAITNPEWFFFSADVPNLLYYSHIPALLVSLLIGLFVFYKSRKQIEGKIILSLALVFASWVTINLITWTNNNSDVIFFAWSFFGILFTLLSVFSYYLFAVYISKKDLPFYQKLVIICISLPVVIFTATRFNIFEFDLTVCGIWEGGVLFNYYYYATGLLSLIAIIVLGVHRYRAADNDLRKQILLLGTGIGLFLFSLFNTSFIAEWLVTAGLANDFELEQYGLFGMIIFMAFLTYLIVRFKAFNIKLIGAQALVIALVILIGSQFFFVRSSINRILVAFTLTLTGIIGLLLIRSVKKEVSLREELEKANEGQSNLLHFITHQVKGYFTKSRNVFNELLTEPDYGPLPETAKGMVQQGFDSLTEGVQMVQQVLSASSIEKGTMQYTMVPVEMGAVVRENAESLRSIATEKGLALNLDIPAGDYKISGDPVQLKEVVRNLIDNAIRYTQKGTITVSLKKVRTPQAHGKLDAVQFSVKDSGIGISSEDKAKLFTKGGRGKDSLKVNVNSTGYGLYIVKQIVEQGHHGRVWVESAGPGTGSTFIVEIPAV